MSTLTLTRTPRPAPTAARARVQRYRLLEPAGLAGWREQPDEQHSASLIDEGQVRAVLQGVRAAQSRRQVIATSGLTVDQAIDVVAGVGSRLGQAAKGGTRAAACMSAAHGARLGLAPGVHTLDERMVVVLAADWSRTRKHPRDVARSYAAIAVSDSAADDAVAQRWLGSVQDEVEVAYQHLAHLYAVSRGTFATLEGISADPNVQGAYVRGYDMLVDALHSAQQDLATVMSPGESPATYLTALRGCFWLCGPLARQLGSAARAASDGHPQADAVLSTVRSRLRMSVERQPRQFFPRRIGDMTGTQFRAMCAGLGFPVPLDDDGITDDTGQRALIAALTAARSKMEAA